MSGSAAARAGADILASRCSTAGLSARPDVGWKPVRYPHEHSTRHLALREGAAAFRRRGNRVLVEQVNDLSVQGSVFTIGHLLEANVQVVGQAQADLFHALMLE